MGAEAQAQDYYVDAAIGDDMNLGTSWNSPLATVQQGIVLAGGAAAEIWVAVGTYPVGPSTATPSATYQIHTDLKLIGGFRNGQLSLGARFPADFELTVLTGDINGDSGGATPVITDDAYHVISVAGSDGWTIDGFKVTYGNAVGLGTDEDKGGGLYAFGDNGGTNGTTVKNVTIQDCRASGQGAGVYAYRVGDSFWSKLVIRDNNCIDTSTSPFTGEGGGMYIQECGPDFDLFNVLFDDNRAIHGGGLFLRGQNDPVRFQNGVWTDNTAWAGGGVFQATAPSTATGFSHCTFAYNSAITPASKFPAGGSAFYREPLSGPIGISSSILYNNLYTQLVSGGRPVHTLDNIGGSTFNVTVKYSDVELISGPNPGWFGTGSISVPPLFINGPARILTLQATSPCIDAADDTALLQDRADLDEDGDPFEFTPLDANLLEREVDILGGGASGNAGGNLSGITDMGAFEVQ